MRKETGDLPGSTQSFAEALEIARAVGAPDGEGAVWNNLGVALMSSAQYIGLPSSASTARIYWPRLDATSGG